MPLYLNCGPNGLGYLPAVDTTDPVVTAPANTTIEFTNGGAGLAHSDSTLTALLATASATDETSPSNPTVTNDLATLADPLTVAGSPYTITFSATDAAGNTGTDSMFLTISEATVSGALPDYSAVQLFDFSGGSGHTWPGWTWYADIAYGASGWVKNDAVTYSNGEHPSCYDKNDYGSGNDGLIDTAFYSPVNTSGASLHIDPGTAIDDRATYWVWHDGTPLSTHLITDTDTDRMSFYMYLEGTPSTPESGDLPTSTMEVGTYLCWDQGGTVYGQGDGCPYESPNQHWYHWFTQNSGAWVHILVDAHPQHQRGVTAAPVNEPALIPYSKYYYNQMMQFYIQQAEVSVTNSEFWVDEIEYYSTLDTPEPNQNDDSVCSLWVGYWSAGNYWELGFMDSTVDGDIKKTYEVRYSDAEITNANWESSNSITPLIYGGVAATGSVELMSRANGYKQAAKTKFILPSEFTTTGDVVYFAVKDVSVFGGNIGTSYPYNRGDDANAANDLVKTINYKLP
mgnify:CR=1 FL=1